MTLPERMSFKRRVFNASALTLLNFGLAQVIRFGNNLLMTRLLVPESFGVIAIANMTIVCLAMFSDIGLPQSVVQSKRGNEPVFLNTIWVTQIVRGLVLYAIALLVSILLAVADGFDLLPKGSVYSDPSLPYVTAVLSVSIVILGFQSTKLFEAGRNLSFGRVTINSVIAQLTGLACMLGWVSVDRSVWALVAGNIATMAVTSLLSHIALPGTSNRWQWDKTAFHEVLNFGKWMFLSSILGFLATSGDRLLLGGLISTSELGVYVIAFLLFSSVDQVMSKIFIDVSFPALSEVARERRDSLKSIYYRFFTIAALASYFCSGALMFSGLTFVRVLYDSRYHDAGWILETLALALTTLPFRVAASCLLALGLSKIYSHLVAVRVVTLFVLTPLGFHFWGLQGAVWGIVASYFSSVPMTIFYLQKYKLMDWWRELLLAPAWLVGVVAAEIFNLAVRHFL
jgi:O-antigen/teichoic acid export membrane protein